MDEEFQVQKNLNFEEFFTKPDCPVKIGDRFYKNYHVPNSLNYGVVEAIEETKDDQGTYYIITARFPNITIGINVKKLSSRMFTPGAYTIIRKGVEVT